MLGLVLCPVLLLADDHIVQSDRLFDFSALRTFLFRDQTIAIDHPALNNPIVVTNMVQTIRSRLTSRGLTEAAGQPDVFVDFSIGGQDYSVGPFGRASRIPPGGRGRRGTGGESIQPVGFTEGVLVIDLVARESDLLIWRGVYRDTERDGSKFAEQLPGDARELLSEFPPMRR